jgi:hypothetical protein
MNIYVLHKHAPYEVVTGNTPDITEYDEFCRYVPISYYNETNFCEDIHRVNLP